MEEEWSIARSSARVGKMFVMRGEEGEGVASVVVVTVMVVGVMGCVRVMVRAVEEAERV